MAIVPIAEGNRVQRAPLARVNVDPQQAGSMARMIGEGLKTVGAAGAQYAEIEERILDQEAEEEGKRLDTEHITRVAEIRSRVREARGIEARPALGQAQEELKKLEGDLIARTSNPVSRSMLQRTMQTRAVSEMAAWGDYAAGQQREAEDKASEGRQATLQEAALDHPEGSEQSLLNLEGAIDEVRSRGQRRGWDMAQTDAQLLGIRSAYHSERVNQLYGREDVEGARAYLDANRDEMSAEAEASGMRLIRGELQANRVEEDIAGAAPFIYSEAAPEGVAPAAGSGGGGSVDPASVPGQIAATLSTSLVAGRQLSPAVVAGFLGNGEVESAGWKKGASGDDGTAHGYFQWREERVDNFVKEIGVHPSQASPDQNARFLIWELNNPGKAGMTVEQRDAILDADSPAKAAALIDEYYERSKGHHRDRRVAAAERYGSGAGAVSPPPGETRWRSPLRTGHTVVSGGEYGARRDYGTHQARDYAQKPGTPVYPMAHGTVADVRRTEGGGNEVEIRYSDGSRSIYKHLEDGSAAQLRQGQEVTPDDRVGAVGNTGTASSGPHLHAELVTPEGKKIDPETIVGEGARMPTPVSGRRIDIARAEGYARDQVERGAWSRSRARLFTDGVRSRAGQEMQFRAAEENDAQRQYGQWLDGRKSAEPPQWTDIPAEIARRLPPGSQAQIREGRQRWDDARAQQAAEAERISKSTDALLELERLSISDQNGFVSMMEQHGASYRGVIGESDYLRLSRRAEELRRGGGTPPSEIMGMIGTMLPNDMGMGQAPRTPRGQQEAANRTHSAAIDRDKIALMNAVQERLRRQLGVQQARPTDIQAAIAAETTRVRGPLGFEMPRYRLQAIGYQGNIRVSVPNNAIPTIREVLRRSGVQPTEHAIAQEYIDNRHLYGGQ